MYENSSSFDIAIFRGICKLIGESSLVALSNGGVSSLGENERRKDPIEESESERETSLGDTWPVSESLLLRGESIGS